MNPSEGRAFQYIGGAIVEMHQDGTLMADPGYHDPDKPLPGAVVRASVEAPTAPRVEPEEVIAPSRAASAAPITSPGAVLKAAKARVAQIRAELRNMKRLQKELGELERLITAAKKPVAIVRNIDQARHAR